MSEVHLCWMCRTTEATTGEHKWPASYFRRIPEAWNELVHGTWDGEVFHTQGVGSQNLKNFVLCANCNNAVSRDQDRALDAFLVTLAEHHAEVVAQEYVDVSHAAEHDPLDLYRALIKLEFSRLYADGVAVPDTVANFVSGGDDWRSVNALVRIQFRLCLNLIENGFAYPSESDGHFYEPPYFIAHQINFGWLGVHYVYAPQERPDLPWWEWSMGRVPLTPCVFEGATVDPSL